MFSYRHAFHAGNHADVLKHLVSMQLFSYMNQKPAPYIAVDTHAGAGVYSLDGGYAAKSAEYETGISRLWLRTDLPPAVQQYVNLVRQLNPDGRLRYYPGSPYIADMLLLEDARLRLFEMHPSDTRILLDNFERKQARGARSAGDDGHGAERPASSGGRRGKRVIIQHADGFAGLKALLPPPSRRAVVLIDPPYEDKNDYRYVKDCLVDAIKRFPTGTYAVWYPILQRSESQQLPDKLKRLPCKSWLNVTLSVSSPSPDGFGLHSSGMFVINPPWTLEALLKGTMPYLVAALGTDAGARFTLESVENPVVKSRGGD